MSFSHLHVHSAHSLYHSTLTVEEAVEGAIRLGMNALAITDYDSVYAAHDFIRYYHKVAPPFKPIIGCELHVKPILPIGKRPSPFHNAPHLTVLCKNETGYKNLCKLLEIGWNEGFYMRPTVTFEQIAEYNDGLIVLSGCPGCEVAKHFMSGNLDTAEDVIVQYRRLFGDDYYLELIRNGFDEHFETAYTIFLLNMSKKLGIKVVATNDVHCYKKEDRKKLQKLEEANLGNMAKSIPFPTDDWLKSEEDMLSRFLDYPEAIANTEEIVCKIELFEVPQWTVPSPHWNHKDYLKTVGECLRIIE